MKNYTIKYVETYSGLYDIEAESYEQAVQTLEERLHEGAEQGPDVCTDSYFEPASDGVKETENCEPEGKWFYADIESLDEDFQKISLPVVVCDQCNTFFPVAGCSRPGIARCGCHDRCRLSLHNDDIWRMRRHIKPRSSSRSCRGNVLGRGYRRPGSHWVQASKHTDSGRRVCMGKVGAT